MRRLIRLPCIYLWVRAFLFILLRVKVLELPGQRRARFFNTRPFPLLCCFVLFGSVSVVFFCVLVSVCLLFCVGGLVGPPSHLCVCHSILIEVLESSDQRRVRILNTPPTPLYLYTLNSYAGTAQCDVSAFQRTSCEILVCKEP